jgi:hypothetical protein
LADECIDEVAEDEKHEKQHDSSDEEARQRSKPGICQHVFVRELIGDVSNI